MDKFMVRKNYWRLYQLCDVNKMMNETKQLPQLSFFQIERKKNNQTKSIIKNIGKCDTINLSDLILDTRL